MLRVFVKSICQATEWFKSIMCPAETELPLSNHSCCKLTAFEVVLLHGDLGLAPKFYVFQTVTVAYGRAPTIDDAQQGIYFPTNSWPLAQEDHSGIVAG